MTRLTGALVAGAATLMIALPSGQALAADDTATELGTESTRSGADAAVGVVAGVAALAAGGGLVVAARRRKV